VIYSELFAGFSPSRKPFTWTRRTEDLDRNTRSQKQSHVTMEQQQQSYHRPAFRRSASDAVKYEYTNAVSVPRYDYYQSQPPPQIQPQPFQTIASTPTPMYQRPGLRRHTSHPPPPGYVPSLANSSSPSPPTAQYPYGTRPFYATPHGAYPNAMPIASSAQAPPTMGYGQPRHPVMPKPGEPRSSFRLSPEYMSLT
jgi:hypothetical protein